VYLIDGFHCAHARSLLSALLYLLLVFLLRLHEHRSLGRIMAAWLFNINVLARLKSGNRKRRVPVIRSGDGDSVC
jgi:hypothetical protein